MGLLPGSLRWLLAGVVLQGLLVGSSSVLWQVGFSVVGAVGATLTADFIRVSNGGELEDPVCDSMRV